jgi:hypothetical protein
VGQVQASRDNLTFHMPPFSPACTRGGRRYFHGLAMAEFPKTREEQLRMMADPKRAHLARPAEGADPEMEAFLESLGPPPVAREIEKEAPR